MDVNLKSTFFLTQGVARGMLADGRGGKVINIASLLSLQGGIRIPSYTGEQRAGWLASLGFWPARMGGKGHQCERHRTGYFETNNTAGPAGRTPSAVPPFSPAFRRPLGPALGTRGAAVFLAARASDYVHGVVLPVDGGWLAR